MSWHLFPRKKKTLSVTIIEVIDYIIIGKKVYKPHLPELVLTTIVNNQKFTFMEIVLFTDQSIAGVLALLDSSTKQPIADASFANVSASVDSAVAQAAVDGANVTLKPVAAGAASVVISAEVTYTDASTQEKVTKTLTSESYPITVSARPTPEGVELSVNWGTPS